MQGRTTIIIAHRPATIALADRVVLLDDGRVVADGTHEGLLETSAEYREVLARAELDDRGAASSTTTAPRRPAGGGATEWAGWGDAVPEETLSRDEATRVVRRLFRMLRPRRGARSSSRSFVLMAQAAALLAGPLLVAHGIDDGLRSEASTATRRARTARSSSTSSMALAGLRARPGRDHPRRPHR